MSPSFWICKAPAIINFSYLSSMSAKAPVGFSIIKELSVALHYLLTTFVEIQTKP